ncbi:MAG TPA: DinB family protein [Pirellulales bacterium]|nr:DinB family protein [Pirellulales bacterium]
MFERELTLYRFNLNYLRLLTADIAEGDMHVAPFPGANPPVWILGHLAVATDYAGRQLGLERVCPREWHAQFAPGSKPADLKDPLPTKSELMAAIENGHRRASEAAPKASAETMASPHAVELLKPTVLKTVGDVVAHLMTTHESFHLAQLSACRRKAGKGMIV